MTNILPNMDSKEWRPADDFLDPLSYPDRLAKIPKMVIFSSDDEFMMFEWTSAFWNRLTGENYLIIVPNSEHHLVTGMSYVINAASWFVNKIIYEDT